MCLPAIPQYTLRYAVPQLFMALYRIIEPCGGRILIDGIDTSTIGLWDLRSKLSLVPQVRLFSYRNLLHMQHVCSI